MITPIKNPLEAIHDNCMKYIRRKHQGNQKRIIKKEDLEKAILGDKNEKSSHVAWIDVQYKTGQADESEILVLENVQKGEIKSRWKWMIFAIILLGITMFGLAHLQKYISDIHDDCIYPEIDDKAVIHGKYGYQCYIEKGKKLCDCEEGVMCQNLFKDCFVDVDRDFVCRVVNGHYYINHDKSEKTCRLPEKI